MRSRRIVRVVNALANQQRKIVWLECHHKISIYEHELIVKEPELREAIKAGSMDCPFCPDAEVRAEKTAQQLYREAGEP